MHGEYIETRSSIDVPVSLTRYEFLIGKYIFLLLEIQVHGSFYVTVLPLPQNLLASEKRYTDFINILARS